MDTAKVDIQALHFEHQLWTNELAFYADEIAIFEKGLGELVRNTTDREVLAELEQLQNQFIRQKEVLDELKHDIHLHEQAMGKAARFDEKIKSYPDHTNAREDMERYRQLYHELKGHFTRFMSKNR